MKKLIQEEIDKKLYILKNEKPLLGFFPLSFDNGFTLTEISIRCTTCHKDISGTVRATVIDSTDVVKTINGVGFCTDCNLFIDTHTRFRTDGDRLLREWIENGHWVFSEFVREPVKRHWLKRILFPFYS